jgi:hypothetical protein
VTLRRSFLMVASFAIVALCAEKVVAQYIGGAIQENNQ